MTGRAPRQVTDTKILNSTFIGLHLLFYHDVQPFLLISVVMWGKTGREMCTFKRKGSSLIEEEHVLCKPSRVCVTAVSVQS